MKINNTSVGVGASALIGGCAGLAADKLVKINPDKKWTNFVSDLQAKIILKKTTKDVFELKTKRNVLSQAQGALDNADNIAKANKKGLENLAKRFNLPFNDESNAKSLLKNLSDKTDVACETFASSMKKQRKANFVIAGAMAFAAVAAVVINKIKDNKED